MVFFLHGWRDSNSQPTVLETATLPIELHPFNKQFPAFLLSFSGRLAQSPEPHPYTQPKRTAKVEEKAWKQKAWKQKAKSFYDSELFF